MLSPQQGQIEEALRRGGLGADAATEAASAIANCAIALVHRAFVSLDYTPKAFRFITPDARKFQFPGVDAPIGNPDFRAPTIPASEGLPIPDAIPREPQDARQPFGPEQDPYSPPERPNPGDGERGMGPLRQFKVVSGIRWNKNKKRIDVEYSEIWAHYGGATTTVPLTTPTVEVLTDLRLTDSNKLYGDTMRIGVVSMGERLNGAVVIEGVACDTTTEGDGGATNGYPPDYVPGGV